MAKATISFKTKNGVVAFKGRKKSGKRGKK